MTCNSHYFDAIWKAKCRISLDTCNLSHVTCHVLLVTFFVSLVKLKLKGYWTQKDVNLIKLSGNVSENSNQWELYMKICLGNGHQLDMKLKVTLYLIDKLQQRIFDKIWAEAGKKDRRRFNYFLCREINIWFLISC